MNRLLLLLSFFLICCENPSTELEKQQIERPQNEQSLRENLHALSKKNHKPLTYRKLWEAIKTIDGEGDSVRLIYSQELRSKDLNGGMKGDWNKEHVWPVSYGIEETGVDYTDLYNIFPCDMQTNSRKGNKFFDDETDEDSWCPPDNMKGDIARAMFYMAVRYEGEEPDTLNLELSNEPDVNNSRFGMLSTLLKWHVQDPVDDRERQRNDRVEMIQGNRNPFVDYPEKAIELYEY